MANQEHLDKLKEGVEVWNQWRESHRDIRPDLIVPNLSGADLYGANLSLANLNGANLSQANLSYAYLVAVKLNDANLSDADLSDADLSGADLIGANLRDANLGDANLTFTILNNALLNNAVLRGAYLISADLISADLSGATLFHTVLSYVDLSTTKGLLEIRHEGPSRVELHSVFLPQDGSALHFLRGAGVPDEWVSFYQATMQDPIQYHSCFISYSSDDYEIAKRLHADLQDQGVRCWFAPHDLVPGDYFREKIDQAIHMQDKLLLILSTHSMNSTWVQHEVRKALNREANQNRTILFPISLDGSVFRSPSAWAQELREERHIGDFTQWETYEVYTQKFQTLLKQLKAPEVKP